jgi:hypothetical protein
MGLLVAVIDPGINARMPVDAVVAFPCRRTMQDML